jgi:hypothetical protein
MAQKGVSPKSSIFRGAQKGLPEPNQHLLKLGCSWFMEGEEVLELNRGFL